MEQDRINLFQGLKADGNYSKDYNAFIGQYFSNEAGVNDLWGKLINGGDYSKPLKDFYSKYACDLEWAKVLTYCGGTSSSTNSSGAFGCLLKDPDLKLTTNKTQVVYVGPDFKWTFFDNNRFYQDKPVQKGSWACDGADHYIIKGDNGKNYSSKTGQWTTGTPPPPTPDSSSFTDTTLTGDDLKAGKVVKQGMKGDIVGKIQELLIAKGYKDVSKSGTVDKIFGSRTREMVKAFQSANGLTVDGAVGKDTWPKLNDKSAVSAGSSGGTNQAVSVDNKDDVPGSDVKFVRESRKKILRKYLLEHK